MMLELFSGKASISFAMQATMCGVYIPWDRAYGEKYNVLTSDNMLVINKLLEEGQLQGLWCGMPCQSYSVAKTPAVRSLEEPMGLCSNNEYDTELVRCGNELLEYTADTMEYANKCGAAVVLENPWPCYSWVTERMQKVMNNPDFALTVVRQDYFDCPWVKHTAFLHNTPSLHLAAIGSEGMQRTYMLRGKVQHDGEWVYKTSLAEAYSPSMATEVAQLLAGDMRTNWARKQRGQEPLKANKAYDESERHKKGIPLRVQEWETCPDQQQPYVPNGGGAPKGLSQMEHYVWACTQPHEFEDNDPVGVCERLRQNICQEMTDDADALQQLDEAREHLVDQLILMATKLEPQRQQWWRSLHPDVQPVLTTMHYPLQKALMDEMRYHKYDKRLATDLETGFEMIGALPRCELLMTDKVNG